MKKVGLLFLVLVLALGALGIGYAKWSDTVEIVGTVNTGTMSLGIRDISVLDQGPDPQMCPGHNEEEKDVAFHESLNDGKYVCTKVIDKVNVDFYESVTENITNAYPWYKSGTTLWVGHCGTIPVKVEDIDLKVTSGNAALLDYLVIGDWELDLDGVVFDSGCGCASLKAALWGYQLHGCHYLSVTFEFYFVEEVGKVLMPQNANVSFTITVTASQWNEVP